MPAAKPGLQKNFTFATQAGSRVTFLRIEVSPTAWASVTFSASTITLHRCSVIMWRAPSSEWSVRFLGRRPAKRLFTFRAPEADGKVMRSLPASHGGWAGRQLQGGCE